jgi:hypothetical protein
VCIVILAALKSKIEKRGLLPENDLESLNRVYGNQPTEYGAMMVNTYNEVMQMDHVQCTEDDKARKSKHAEYQQKILEALDTEIHRQRDRSKLKTDLADMECPTNFPVPPPVPILDLILRYSSTNVRELKHLLGALERIRGLKRDG